MNDSPSNIFYSLLLLERYQHISQVVLVAIGMNRLTNSCLKISLTGVIWTFNTFSYNFGVQ